MAGIHLALCRLKTLAHDFGVTATARAFFFIVDLDEFAAQRDHLVSHFGTGVVGAHDGAQARGRANGGQASHAGTGDEHFGWGHLACSRDLPVEETAKRIGRLHHGAVTADAGHRGQCIHLLGTAERARQGVDRKRRDLFGRQLLHQIRVLGRP